MKAVILLLILLVATSAISQPALDGTEVLWRLDGLYVFFDASVDWSYGGILMSPILEYVQTQPVCDAYLVLVQPTAAELGGYRLRMEVEGFHTILAEEVIGAPLSAAFVADELTVAYDPPLPLTGDPVVLYHWSISNPSFHPVSFYLKPPEGAEAPVYMNGAGTEFPVATFNGAFHDFEVPVAVLNGFVTPNETASFSDVKMLFR